MESLKNVFQYDWYCSQFPQNDLKSIHFSELGTLFKFDFFSIIGLMIFLTIMIVVSVAISCKDFNCKKTSPRLFQCITVLLILFLITLCVVGTVLNFQILNLFIGKNSILDGIMALNDAIREVQYGAGEIFSSIRNINPMEKIGEYKSIITRVKLFLDELFEILINLGRTGRTIMIKIIRTLDFKEDIIQEYQNYLSKIENIESLVSGKIIDVLDIINHVETDGLLAMNNYIGIYSSIKSKLNMIVAQVYYISTKLNVFVLITSFSDYVIYALFGVLILCNSKSRKYRQCIISFCIVMLAKNIALFIVRNYILYASKNVCNLIPYVNEDPINFLTMEKNDTKTNFIESFYKKCVLGDQNIDLLSSVTKYDIEDIDDVFDSMFLIIGIFIEKIGNFTWDEELVNELPIFKLLQKILNDAISIFIELQKGFPSSFNIYDALKNISNCQFIRNIYLLFVTKFCGDFVDYVFIQIMVDILLTTLLIPLAIVI